jgi:hypothetical protein
MARLHRAKPPRLPNTPLTILRTAAHTWHLGLTRESSRVTAQPDSNASGSTHPGSHAYKCSAAGHHMSRTVKDRLGVKGRQINLLSARASYRLTRLAAQRWTPPLGLGLTRSRSRIPHRLVTPPSTPRWYGWTRTRNDMLTRADGIQIELGKIHLTREAPKRCSHRPHWCARC